MSIVMPGWARPGSAAVIIDGSTVTAVKIIRTTTTHILTATRTGRERRFSLNINGHFKEHGGTLYRRAWLLAPEDPIIGSITAEARRVEERAAARAAAGTFRNHDTPERARAAITALQAYLAGIGDPTTPPADVG